MPQSYLPSLPILCTIFGVQMCLKKVALGINKLLRCVFWGLQRDLPLIKPFHLRDVVSLAKLQNQGETLDLEERLVHPRSPLSVALLASVLPTKSTTSTFILDFADEQEHYRGSIQTRRRAGRPEQDVVFLAPLLEHKNGNHAVCQRLLTHVCVKAGEQGDHRIYARLEVGRDEVQVFKNVGFSAYAEEEIFCLTPDRFPPDPRDTLGLRRQTTADSWSLQRLYAAVTPHVVQVAEGLAQGQWQINNHRLSDQGRRLGYVWEREGEILAVLHLRSGRAGYSLRMLLHPDVANQVESLIQTGLSLVGNLQRQPDKPVYSSSRTYQTELGSVLMTCDFQKLATQVVMVKHTTVRARDFLSRLVAAFETPGEVKPAPAPFMKSEAVSTQPVNGKSTADKMI